MPPCRRILPSRVLASKLSTALSRTEMGSWLWTPADIYVHSMEFLWPHPPSSHKVNTCITGSVVFSFLSFPSFCLVSSFPLLHFFSFPFISSFSFLNLFPFLLFYFIPVLFLSRFLFNNFIAWKNLKNKFSLGFWRLPQSLNCVPAVNAVVAPWWLKHTLTTHCDLANRPNFMTS